MLTVCLIDLLKYRWEDKLLWMIIWYQEKPDIMSFGVDGFQWSEEIGVTEWIYLVTSTPKQGQGLGHVHSIKSAGSKFWKEKQLNHPPLSCHCPSLCARPNRGIMTTQVDNWNAMVLVQSQSIQGQVGAMNLKWQGVCHYRHLKCRKKQYLEESNLWRSLLLTTNQTISRSEIDRKHPE